MMELPDHVRSAFQSLDDTIAVTPFPRPRFRTPLNESQYRGSIIDVDVTGLIESPGHTVNFEDLQRVATNAPNSLYGEFHQSLLTQKPITTRAFELVQEFEDMCQQKVDILADLNGKIPQKTLSQPMEMHQALQNERNTWRLVGCLYEDRLQAEAHSDMDMELDLEVFDASEKTIVNKLYDKDHELRQAQLVLDWLEKNAYDRGSFMYSRTEFFQDMGVVWENTLRSLEHGTSARPIVSSLDLDAPIRQQKPLHDLDQEDCQRLNKDLFSLIRCGQLDAAIKLCVRVGQPMKAATLEGWRLYHDPNFSSNGEKELEHVEGNPHRDIWRSVCWGIAEDVNVSLPERALYAALCGHLRVLLPACKSWEDLLWAFFRVYIDWKVENIIRMSSPNREFVSLPEEFTQKQLTMDSIFRELSAEFPSKKETLLQMVQRYLIQDQPHLLLAGAAEEVKSGNSPHSVRFLTHLVLVLQALGRIDRDPAAYFILEKYVSCLIEMNEHELIASYTAQLPKDSQVSLFAKYLRKVKDKESRKKALKLALEEGLDVDAITSTLVESIRKENADLGPVSDEEKAESMEWLLLNPGQMMEAVRQGNALVRLFLIQNNINLAKKVFNMIPPDCVKVLSEMYGFQEEHRSPKLNNMIREYICFQLYLTSIDTFEDWMTQFHRDKPSKPEEPSKNAPFTERVTYEQRHKVYLEKRQAWEGTLQQYTKDACESLYNVLLFPIRGWLVDVHEDPEPEENRKQEMNALRQLALPKVTSLLHKIHYSMEDYSRCIQLADTIADDRRQLFKVFQKEDLKRLCERIQESSRKLLDKSIGPLGYGRN